MKNDTEPMSLDSSESCMSLRGVRVHNLRDVDIDFPIGKLTVVTGVSGAGKSSLVFDTLYAEAQRRYLQSFSPYTRQFLERFDQPDADMIGDLPPAVAVSSRALANSPRATVGTLTEIFDYLRLLLVRAGTVRCLQCGQEVKAQKSVDVLADIDQLPVGTRFTIAFPTSPDSEQDIDSWLAGLKEEGFLRLRIGDDTFRLDQDQPNWRQGQQAWVLVDRLESGKTARERTTDSIETAFARGQGQAALFVEDRLILFDNRWRCARCDILYPAPEARLFHFNSPSGACPSCQGTGVDKKKLPCSECGSSRLSEQTGYVLLAGRTLAELCAATVDELSEIFASSTATGPIESDLLVESIQTRLALLRRLALGHLTLQRSAVSLSGGEAKRIRLTSALASNLAGALYIFDEPTTGLHACHTGALLHELARLRQAGNTVVVIEHDPEIIRAADRIVDLGPGAGEEGGSVVFQGSPDSILDVEDSVTAEFLDTSGTTEGSRRRRPLSQGSLCLDHVTLHNLHDLHVEFPLGVLCAVTGVSGAGKRTLVEHVLYPALCRRLNKKLPANLALPCQHSTLSTQHSDIGDVILIDQQPLTRSARSNPATYVKVFDEIRKLFANTSDARIRNFGPGHFSFNQSGGRCETCQGQGTLDVDMQFLADVSITCPECQGSRFRKEILGVKVRNRSIAEVLDLTVREAFRFFRAQQAIERRLKPLLDVGLDYVKLGQATDTLSGGECQRLKLAGHLATQRKPRCLFLMFEPTAGLHPADVLVLIDCLERLLDMGHSVVVVEHNLDVILHADHIIDLGPGSGLQGGKVVASGRPEEVAAVPESQTGVQLKALM